MISALMVKIKMPIDRTDLSTFFLHHLIWHAGKDQKDPGIESVSTNEDFSLGDVQI